MKTHLVYFSPAFSTREIVRLVGRSLAETQKEYEITHGISAPLFFEEDPVIIGIPVYAGRVPAPAVKALEAIRGNGNTPAILVAVYGNRDYDDALLELQHLTEKNGFRTVGAGAFIARHSIFRQVAAGRPDEKDRRIIDTFAQECLRKLQDKSHLAPSHSVAVKGNEPYKIPGKLPLFPDGDEKCTECGICFTECPAEAIPSDNPRITVTERCFVCTRCISVCPAEARGFHSEMFLAAGKQFESVNAMRKEPELFF